MGIEFLSLDGYIKAKRYRLVNSVLVYENSDLVFERYYNNTDGNSRNQIKSVWKSILSLTLGACVDRGAIQGIDEPICRFLPQFAQNIQPCRSAITIRDLLAMSSGIYWNGGIHYHCPMLEQMRRSKDWIGHIADVKAADYPGDRFAYKEWDVILLSAIIGRAWGSSSWDACNECLYKPLGISSEKWTQSACGVDYPSWGADASSDLTARDMAKIGLLMVGGGEWEGRRVISGDYIKKAISPSKAGYGFLFWLSDKGYHARGFGGQELNVYPDKKIVAVVQAKVTPSGKSYADICGNII